MKRIFRKNQIIITVLAVMIAVAGYLNYSGRLLEEEAGRIASGEDTVLLTAENEGTVLTDTVLDAEDITLDGEISQEAAASDVVEENTGVEDTPGTAVLASTSAGDSLIAQAKLNREQIRAKNKETLLEVINNDNVAEEQRQAAAADMTSITELAGRGGGTAAGRQGIYGFSGEHHRWHGGCGGEHGRTGRCPAGTD